MRWKFLIVFMMIGVFFLGGCTKRVFVSYNELEKTNSVEVTLISGRKFKGTVLKTEPHQITLFQKNRKSRVFAKSSIRSIKRKPPIYDDLGRGISEEEINFMKTDKNAVIYGIGGGALSFGTSFFIGSLAGHSAEEGSTILTATTAVGTCLGTILFVRAGRAKDRRDAIEKIKDKRRSVELQREEKEKKTPDDLRKILKDEKKKQEELRKQREELLRELRDSKIKEE